MLIKRWKAETPLFWKRVIWIGAIMAALGGSIQAAPEDMFPASIDKAAGYMVTIGSTIAVLAKFTKVDGTTEENVEGI